MSRASTAARTRARFNAADQRVDRWPGGAWSRAGSTKERASSTGVRPRLKDAAPVSYHLVWVLALILLAIGLCMVLSVSVTKTVTPGEDRFGYVRDQGITAVVGLALMFLISRFDYRRWLRGASVAILTAAVFLLLLIHIPGVGSEEGGSVSWIQLGPLTFQPSEFAKLALLLAGAHLLSVRRPVLGDFKSFMVPFGLAGVIICGLVLLEPDLGTAIIVAGLLLGLLWIGGMKGRHWLGLTVAAAVPALIVALVDSERRSRILSFLDPFADAGDSGYQVVQALVALGRGGWLGVGPGQSIQKFSYLPEAHTDMIFAILGEEFGLIGTGVVILLFGVFTVVAWRLARQCADQMGRYLLAGCGMLIALQAVVNIGGVVGALPLTGVPLPFMSYGRNSLLVMLVAVGLMLSVARWAPARPASTLDKGKSNVAHIDRGRRDGGSRGTGPSAG